MTTGLGARLGVATTILRRFTSYPAYTHSGVEWLGEIPAHWKVKRLKFAARLAAGQSPASDVVVEGGRGLPFLQGNAEFGPSHPVPRLACDAAPQRAQTGDILLSVRAPVGALNIADQPYGIGRGLCAIRPAAVVDGQFCLYLLSRTRAQLDAVATGSTYDAVSAADVGDLPMLFPTLPEQRAIAAFLDRETARIDELVTKKVRLIELLRERRTALISRAVTKGLDPDAPMKDSGVEWLGRIPAHWDVRRLKTIASVRLSNVDKKTIEGEEVVRLCNYTHVYYNERITPDLDFMPATATKEQVRRFSLRAGDVLITKDSESWTDIAVPGLVASDDLPEVLCGYHLALVRPGAACVGSFLARAFSAAGPGYQFHVAASGITRFGLSGDAIRAGLFSIPPLPEQREIVAFLDRETARIDELAAKVRDAIDRLKGLRTALISAAVTGQIDVRPEAGANA